MMLSREERERILAKIKEGLETLPDGCKAHGSEGLPCTRKKNHDGKHTDWEGNKW